MISAAVLGATKPLVLGNWIAAGLFLGTAVLMAFLIRRLTKRKDTQKDSRAELIDITGRLGASGVLAFGVMYAMRALRIDIGPLFGTLGISAVFIAVGLQPILVNLVSGVLLQARRPFVRGDQITTAGRTGTVIDINSSTTVILAFTGEQLFVPNSEVLQNTIVNWTHDRIRRTDLAFGLPYDCDLPFALETVGKAIREFLDDPNLPGAEAVAVGFGDSAINCQAQFWHYSERFAFIAARSQLICLIVEALEAIDISIPFPQVVVHDFETSSNTTNEIARVPSRSMAKWRTPNTALGQALLGVATGQNLKSLNAQRLVDQTKSPTKAKADQGDEAVTN